MKTNVAFRGLPRIMLSLSDVNVLDTVASERPVVAVLDKEHVDKPEKFGVFLKFSDQPT